MELIFNIHWKYSVNQCTGGGGGGGGRGRERQSTGNLTFVKDLQSNPAIMDTIKCYICFYFSLVKHFQHEPLARKTGQPLPTLRHKIMLYLYLLIYRWDQNKCPYHRSVLIK